MNGMDENYNPMLDDPDYCESLSCDACGMSLEGFEEAQWSDEIGGTPVENDVYEDNGKIYCQDCVEDK